MVMAASWIFLVGGLVALLIVAGTLWYFLSGAGETPQPPR
jgi:hypothetical protein